MRLNKKSGRKSGGLERRILPTQILGQFPLDELPSGWRLVVAVAGDLPARA